MSNEVIGKLDAREQQLMIGKDDNKRRRRAIVAVYKALENSGTLGERMIASSLGGKLVPSLFSKAYAGDLPANWGDIAYGKETSANEELCRIAFAVERASIATDASESMKERGIVGDLASREVTAVVREAIKEQYVANGIPVGIEKPGLAESRENLRRCFAAYRPAHLNK